MAFLQTAGLWPLALFVLAAFAGLWAVIRGARKSGEKAGEVKARADQAEANHDIFEQARNRYIEQELAAKARLDLEDKRRADAENAHRAIEAKRDADLAKTATTDDVEDLRRAVETGEASLKAERGR